MQLVLSLHSLQLRFFFVCAISSLSKSTTHKSRSLQMNLFWKSPIVRPAVWITWWRWLSSVPLVFFFLQFLSRLPVFFFRHCLLTSGPRFGVIAKVLRRGWIQYSHHRHTTQAQAYTYENPLKKFWNNCGTRKSSGVVPCGPGPLQTVSFRRGKNWTSTGLYLLSNFRWTYVRGKLCQDRIQASDRTTLWLIDWLIDCFKSS